MNALFVIADGIGGRPTDYKGMTCLEAARTPNLDKLAQRGSTGLLDPIKPGVRPGSDTAHLSIFGYDPEEVYTGRGFFEALGIGIEMKDGDVSFRTNFATVDENFIVKDRRAGRIKKWQKKLEKALQKLESPQPDVKVIFKASTEHRGALILRGPNLSGQISDIDPHKTGVKVSKAKPLTKDKPSERTARIVNKLVKQSYEILKNLPLNKKREENGKLPANIILPRGAASKPDLISFKEKYGVDGEAIAAGALYIGVARALKLKFKQAEGVTGGADSPIMNKAKLAVKRLNKNVNFVFVHIKGADSCGHDHDAEAKISFIEKIDETIGYLLRNLNWSETHMALTGDHSTPIVYGDHVADPVPIVFVGPNVTPDEVKEFNERSVLKGGVGRISGRAVPVLLGYSNLLEKFGE